MKNNRKAIFSTIATILMILLILFVRSDFFAQMTGGGGDDAEIVELTTSEVQDKAVVTPSPTPEKTEEPSSSEEEVTLQFRSKKLLNQHYDKHGKEMGFASAEEYEKAAAKVVANPDALHKTEKEDGDDVYYLEDTNEFVIVSKDGYLRTYFLPSAGKKYYDKQ